MAWFGQVARCIVIQNRNEGKNQPTVELQDINGTTVKIVIEFIYTGTIVINNENLLDLLPTADYLQMDVAK